MMHGSFGRYLRIDLARARSTVVAIDPARARALIGGVGLGTALLMDETTAGFDPLGEEACIVFSFSPMVGTPITTSAKLAVVAKSPVERLKAFKKERGWRHLKLYCSAGNSFNRDYHAEGPESDDDAAINVFVKRDGKIHHFWGGEMTGKTSDPGQDPRGAPDPMPLWTILDMTPGGRGTDWYPQLEYDK